jgi:sialate O-acetylesterase
MDRMYLHARLLFAALIVFAVARSARAEVSISPIFGPGMVLQRDVPCTVWGAAAPKEAVTVTLADVERQTQADADGRWTVEFPTLSREKNPDPLKLTVADNDS